MVKDGIAWTHPDYSVSGNILTITSTNDIAWPEETIQIKAETSLGAYAFRTLTIKRTCAEETNLAVTFGTALTSDPTLQFLQYTGDPDGH